ncbi:transcription antitermination factor NusB [Sulfidibacter corallicola]|uniref:Transcription antitermination protein NusB n=1 Tax=Sulfidibacter corallicola TaxID=2818388 RepID=A0A8A4TTQ8_SULCO|nr:transcription antitermination factor NusB [Sulfidibacter corallicola]QTD52757.1 transcription antitermination factor NusB [Sulfidibacter corallicola]
MSSRSRGRQFAVQMIYQQEFTGYDLDQVLEHFWRNINADETTRVFSRRLAEGVIERRQELDFEIQGYLKNWTLDRIAVLDRIILELALFELVSGKSEVPWRVVIDEAVTLAKMFSTDKSPTFINGVLHAWCAKNVSDFENAPETNGSAARAAQAEEPPAPGLDHGFEDEDEDKAQATAEETE